MHHIIHYIGGEHKVFIGLEKTNSIEITRLKSIHYSPKVILKFDKNTGFTEYKMRLGLVPFSILALLLVTFLLSIIYSVQDGKIDTDLSSIALITGLFLIIIFREIILHHKRLVEIIHKIDSEDV